MGMFSWDEWEWLETPARTIDKNGINTIKAFAEEVKETVNPTIITLTVISKILVDVSKSHISSDEAFDKMREVLGRTGVFCSRVRFEQAIDNLVQEVVGD
jgi:hypothetical protein